MSWLQLARIRKDYVIVNGKVKTISPGEEIRVYAGTGRANSLNYINEVESNFVRTADVNPTTSLSDAYGLMVDDDSEAAEAAISQLSAEQQTVLNSYNSTAVVEEDLDTPPAAASEISANCLSLPSPGSPPNLFSSSLQLSTNFTYGHVTTQCAAGSAQIIGSKRGLTPNQQLCNLKNLCENILEPLAESYGRTNIQINSGYRNNGSLRSQHEIGQAVDLRFLDLPFGRDEDAQRAYYERAKEIRANLVYDQLLLEVFGNQGPWIHISFSLNNCRRIVRTFFSHNIHRSGLILVG